MSKQTVIAKFADARGLNVTELARVLEISKGHASDLYNGNENVGRRVAAKLSQITGQPWWSFLPEPKADVA